MVTQGDPQIPHRPTEIFRQAHTLLTDILEFTHTDTRVHSDDTLRPAHSVPPIIDSLSHVQNAGQHWPAHTQSPSDTDPESHSKHTSLGTRMLTRRHRHIASVSPSGGYILMHRHPQRHTQTMGHTPPGSRAHADAPTYAPPGTHSLQTHTHRGSDTQNPQDEHITTRKPNSHALTRGLRSLSSQAPDVLTSASCSHTLFTKAAWRMARSPSFSLSGALPFCVA